MAVGSVTKIVTLSRDTGIVSLTGLNATACSIPRSLAASGSVAIGLESLKMSPHFGFRVINWEELSWFQDMQKM